MAEIGLRTIPRPALGDWLAPAVGTAIFVAALLKGSAVIGDPDIQWHVEAGRWIATHLSVPDRDPFSHSMLGAPWHAHEWLSELLFWWAFHLGGWGAVATVAAASAGLAFALLATILQRHLQPRHTLVLCTASFALASQHLLARPHILTWPILVLWTAALCTAVERRAPPSLFWLLLMALWANLHGGYVFGLALAGLFAAEAIWRAEASARAGLLLGWGAFLLAAAFASLMTPHAPAAGVRFALGFLDGSGFVAPIGEWQPADFRTLSGLQLVLLGILALALLGRLRLPPFRVLLLVGLVYLALSHVRHGELLGLVAPLAVAACLGANLYGGAVVETVPAGRGRLWGVCASAAVLVLAPALYFGRAEVAPPSAVAPVAALESARSAELLGQPVLNSFNFGGFLIFSGVPVFIDGRADFYGSTFLRRYLDAVTLTNAGALEALLAERGIGWTMLQTGTPAILLLDRLPGWERVYTDETAVVHRRRPGTL
ncbi:MAG TPA: hypothetical protein VED46_17440 [Alphaproteobacteria bacterium]|nr:hypothetical protein [Alphaproteobacteria bacterium]